MRDAPGELVISYRSKTEQASVGQREGKTAAEQASSSKSGCSAASFEAKVLHVLLSYRPLGIRRSRIAARPSGLCPLGLQSNP